MRKEEAERLKTLGEQKSEPEVGFFARIRYGKDLDINDLLLLLRYDEDVRAAICEAVAGDGSPARPKTPNPHGEEDIEHLAAPVPAAALRREEVPHPRRFDAPAPTYSATPSGLQGFAPERRLLELVQQDAELRQDWLGDLVAAPPDRQLVKVIVRASQWQQLDALWERLAQRCRTRQCPAQAQELELMTACLALHNLNWEGRAATLRPVPVGERYDPHTQQRGNRSGDRVKATWLPGLVNAGGQLVKLPVIEAN